MKKRIVIVSLLFVLPIFVFAQSQPKAFDVDSNTVALWHFDEGTGNVLHDASPYHNDGVIHNAIWTVGRFDSALYFDGLTSYIVVPMSPSLRPPNAFTVEAWISLDTLDFTPMAPPDTAVGTILSCNGPYPYGGGYQAQIVTGQGLRVAYRTGNDVIFHHSGYTRISSARHFYHVAGVYKDTTVFGIPIIILKTYLNGFLKDSVVFTDPISYGNTTNLYIGSEINGRALGGSGVREFPGIIDEMRISNVARNPQEFSLRGITVSNNALDFGLVRLADSLKKNIDISNLSFSDTVYINEINVNNANFHINSNSFSLLPASSHSLDVTYVPSAAVVDTGTLTISSNNLNVPALVIHLFGQGIINSAVDTNTVALWHFDEGTGNVLHDASPYHNDGVIHNAIWTLGKFGNALHFNGLTSYVILPNTESLKPLKEFTLEAWISPDTLQFDYIAPPEGSEAIIMSNLGYYPSGGGYQVELRSSPGVGYYFSYRAIGTIFNETGYTPLAHSKQFYHVASVYKRINTVSGPRTVLKNFVDGALTDSAIFSEEIHYADTPSFYIGTNLTGRALGGIGVHEFPGIIDEIRVSKVAREPREFGLRNIIVSNQALNFGLVKVNESAVQVITISNTSFVDTLFMDSISVNNSKFFVSTTPFILLPTSSQTIEITFTPTEVSVDTGTLVIVAKNSGISPASIRLSGKGFVLNASPVINTIRDIPDDQGRQVRVIWYPSIYDSPSESLKVNTYSIWRRVDQLGASQILAAHKGTATFYSGNHQFAILNGELWDFISSLPAVRFDQYAYVAPTLYNATRFNIRWSVFRIAAHTATGEFFFSDPDSGFSSDNIFPPAPSSVVVGVNQGRVSLTWDEVNAPDVQQYNIYRSASPYVVPSEYSRVGITSALSYSDTTIIHDSTYYYIVTAIDSSGNESDPSKTSSSVTVTDIQQGGSGIPTDFILSKNFPNPFNPTTNFSYGIPVRSRVRLTVFNIIGQKVLSLVDEIQPAGFYARTWQADVASGIYLYRIEATDVMNPSNSFVKTGKMLLIK
jgi:hypothetical protein